MNNNNEIAADYIGQALDIIPCTHNNAAMRIGLYKYMSELKKPIDTFAPTCTMRIVKSKKPIQYIRSESIGGSYKIYRETLQQLWVDAEGNQEWRDVPTVGEVNICVQ
jgi:hypothetical protein